MRDMLEQPDQPLILLVDDTAENLQLMSELLFDHYRLKVATSGENALRIAAGSVAPDLILLDIMMPGMDGYEVCRQLKANPQTANIPVIFLTAKSDEADEQKGFDLGAVDYFTKPISPALILSRINAHLQLKLNADFQRDRNEYLELAVRHRTRELEQLQQVTIETLANLAAMRDNPRGNHLARVERFMRVLAQALVRQQPGLEDEMSEEAIERLGKSALLHGIGKLVLPDRLLLAPQQALDDDLRLLHQHTEAGRAALEAAEAKLGSQITFLTDAKHIVYSQHEHWDGSGYPQGLRGAQIPLSARLMALVDAYEDLTSRHPYRQVVSHAQATAQITSSSGHIFDPSVVLAFIEVADEFASIALELADDAEAIRYELQRLNDSLGEPIELGLPQSDSSALK